MNMFPLPDLWYPDVFSCTVGWKDIRPTTRGDFTRLKLLTVHFRAKCRSKEALFERNQVAHRTDTERDKCFLLPCVRTHNTSFPLKRNSHRCILTKQDRK